MTQVQRNYHGDSLFAAESAQVEPGRIYPPWLVSMLRMEAPPMVYAKATHLAADQAASIFAAPKNKSIYLIGTNDRAWYHIAGLPLFQNILTSQAYYMSGSMITTRQPTWTYTAGWFDYIAAHPWAAIGRYSNTPNSVASVDFPGGLLLIGYSMADGNGGLITVKIDGNVVGTINTVPSSLIQGGAGHSQYAPGVFRLTNQPAGVLTLTPTGSGFVMIDWIGGLPSTQLHLLTLPKTRNGDDAEVAAYNAAINVVAAQCATDGFPVSMIDTGSVVRLNEMAEGPSAFTLTNSYHPNNHGAINIAVKIAASV